MRFVAATLAIVAVCASAAAATAEPNRISDVQFIAANRCLGIESAQAFATPDTDALRRLVKSQTWGRDPYVYYRADAARNDGQDEASHPSAMRSARLASERDGVCRALVSIMTAATPSATHNMMQ